MILNTMDLLPHMLVNRLDPSGGVTSWAMLISAGALLLSKNMSPEKGKTKNVLADVTPDATLVGYAFFRIVVMPSRICLGSAHNTKRIPHSSDATSELKV